MPPKRKSSAKGKQPVKRHKASSSRIWSVKDQKQHLQQPAMFSREPEQGPSLFHTGECANIYKEVDNYQRNKERRIILIGKTGTGKSTLGNAMLGCKRFETDGVQMQSITKHCHFGQKKSNDGKDIVVIDTPGLKDTKLEQAQIIEELCKCTAMTAPGPHAFCLVIRGDDRFTQENIDTLDEFCAFFGEEIYKYVIVVFTHKANMGKRATTDDCLSALPSEFVTKLLKEGGEKIAMESKAEKKELEKQINELFKLIEDIIERNDGGYYSQENFKAAEEAFRKRIPKLQQEAEKLFEGKKKSLDDEYKEKGKQFEEEKNKLAKKLQKKKKKIKQEKQSKEKEKRKKDACVAQIKRLKAKHQKEIKSLEKKQEKIKAKFQRKMEKVNREEVEYLRATVSEDRRIAREAVLESTGFREVSRNAEQEGAGLADRIVPIIGNAISTLASWFWR